MTEKSFTLIDVLVGSALMLIVFWGVFGAYQLGLHIIGQNQSKIEATAIANQQLEIIRNLPYGSVGVRNSFPDGILEQTTTTVRNNIPYTVETRVDYVVDAADGLSVPVDECPNDYKKAQVDVSWAGRFPGRIKLSTDIGPKNISQECEAVGGILVVSVFDAQGTMVPSPLIEVRNPQTGQLIKSAVPFDGKHYFSLATSTYKVVVSKTDYSGERTYSSQEVAVPIKPHPIVLQNTLIPLSFSIDQLGSLTVQTRGSRDLGYPVIGDVTLGLKGAKIIGYDADEDPVYKYSQNHATNAAGEEEILDLEWDYYNFSVDQASGFDLVDIESPSGVTTTQPIGLAPDTNQSVRLILSSENSLILTVQNASTSEPIFSAKAALFNAGLGYDKIQYTDEDGKTYFIPLQAATYRLTVEAAGYASATTTVSVSGDAAKIIQLEQIE